MGWVELSGLLLWIQGRGWIWISNLGRIVLKYRLGGGFSAGCDCAIFWVTCEMKLSMNTLLILIPRSKSSA
jgi:hypothetical protein